MNWILMVALNLCLPLAPLLGQGAPELEMQNPSERLKVVTWNVLYGFNHGRSAAQGEQWIREQRPAVLALQELNGFTNESLQAAAERFGHPYAVLQKERGFSMGLTSTSPIEVLERRVEGFHHGYLHCKTHGIEFFVVHFWPGKEHEVETVLAKARSRVAAGARVAILGDFNSQSEKDTAFLAKKAIEPQFDSIRRVEEGGFVDVVHRFARSHLYSCPSPITIPEWSKDLGEVASKRQRIDFILADAQLAQRARSATIVQSKALDAISDHYPVVAEFAESSTAPSSPSKSFAFGVIADCQYCDAPTKGQRRYTESHAKLTACVEHLDTLDLAFAVSLGDFIDRDFASFETVVPIFESLRCAIYHVLGNHDYDVDAEHKAAVPGRMGMVANYYEFMADGWRFVVLDGNDISLHAHAEGTPGYAAAKGYHLGHAPDAPIWNGAIGPDQLKWFDAVLRKADEMGEKVITLCHFPVFPKNIHNLWNADEVLTVIEAHPCVKVYLNGHNHAGNYGVKGGVHFLTLKGMVDTKDTSYAAIEVHAKHLSILGFGRELDRTLKIR